MEITETTMGSGAFWVLQRRLEYHSQTGRMLDGLDLITEIENMGTDGVDDLPKLRFYTITSDGEYAAGAPSSSTRSFGKNNNPMYERFIFEFLLSCDRDLGYVQRESSGELGLVDWVGRIKDAIETPAFPNTVIISGCTDARLNDTYVYNNTQFSDEKNKTVNPAYGRWENQSDASIYIVYNPTGSGSWELYADGDIVFVPDEGTGFGDGPTQGLWNADGAIVDPDGITLSVDESDYEEGVNDDGQRNMPDAMLEHTLYKPVNYREREWEQNQTALTTLLEVVMDTRPICRGQRRYNWPEAMTPYTSS